MTVMASKGTLTQIPPTRARVRPEEVDAWLELTWDPDPKARRQAVRALCPCHVRANDERIWERFFAMAEDGDVTVRGAIFHALGDGSPRSLETKVIAALEGMGNDPEPRLRRQVRRLLAQYRRTGKVNFL